MVVYSFFIFDRHCECIYLRQWADQTAPPSSRPISSSSANTVGTSLTDKRTSGGKLSMAEQAKLVFGVIFSLRNMVKKLSGPYVLPSDDSFLCYRTGEYKLHYYETITSLRFVMLTDVRTESMKASLHQVYVNLYVEYVVKNPLSPVEHAGGEGVNNEMFELGIDSFVRTIP
ncbi:hypothetical protein ABW19_dt0203227 [Dactylella cylindrospora]|nr:hypothetical protein ABW19_dt0203227 [Dactylella cylindrospora]